MLALGLLVAVLVAAAPAQGLSPAAQAAPATIHMVQPAMARANLFDTPRVIAHLAIAYGAFHHWVYKPYKAGKISLRHPIKVVKAGLALLFAVHEIKVALKITRGAKSGPLHALNGVLTSMSARFQNVGTLFQKDPGSLTNGQLNNSINGLNSQVNQANGILPVQDAPTGLLGNFS
jgi:hypothetical protein